MIRTAHEAAPVQPATTSQPATTDQPSTQEDATLCTVVVSKGQSRNPVKRNLEQAISEAAEAIDGVRVVVVPHLYDLPKGGESLRLLGSLEGDLVVVSWIFPRAAHWVLDRNGIGGSAKDSWLGQDDAESESGPSADVARQDVAASETTDSETTDSETTASDEPAVQRVASMHPRPERDIYCLDLKTADDAGPFVEEIRRIVGTVAAKHQQARSLPVIGGQLVQVEETTSRRWYPVIDFSRCTNCMECIDFCLFGVYGVDGAETILVEQPDNCRKGCPACSRVCPENAIIFPQHKAPAIAGAETEGDEGFKIDLSQLFGAPAGGDDPIATAARERDEQLLLTGRDAVGIDDQLKKRQAALSAEPKDQLDRLIDSLDELDL